jgi:tetratricopeptide (TPR) repeat protein
MTTAGAVASEAHHRAQRFLWQGDVLRALAAWDEAVAARPGDADMRAAVGAVLHLAGRHAAAVPHLERAARLRPTDWTLRLFFATVLAAAGQQDAGEAELRRILVAAANPGTVQIVRDKLAGRFDAGAAEGRRRASKHAPYESADTPSFAGQVVDLEWAARYPSAHDNGSLVPLFVTYTHLAPLYRPSGERSAPGTLVSGGDYIELHGASLLQTVVYARHRALVTIRPFHGPLGPGDAPSLRQVFLVFDFFFDHARAQVEERVGRADMLGAKFGGFWAIEQGQSADAVSLLTDVVKASPRDPQARLELATALLTDGQGGPALSHLDAALAAWPGYPRALAMRGFIEAIRGDVERGVATIREAIAAKPALYDGYGSLFSLYRRLGRLEDARRIVEQIDEIAPDSAVRARDQLAGPK